MWFQVESPFWPGSGSDTQGCYMKLFLKVTVKMNNSYFNYGRSLWKNNNNIIVIITLLIMNLIDLQTYPCCLSSTYFNKVRMFHEFVIKDTIETKSPEAQVNQLRSQGCHQPQAKDLTRGLVFRPRGWVNIRSEDMAVCKVQHMIHGSVCERDT